MTRIVYSLLLLATLLAGCARSDFPSRLSSGNLNFIVASDMGKRGVSEQKNIAEVMGQIAKQNKIDFLAVAGDPIHDDGVKSVEDDEWKLKIENVYTAPSLYSIPWYVIPGNHEYRGSVQAIMDYSQKSKRWNAPARYYTIEKDIGKSGQKALFVFIDTTPLIDKYRNSDEYSDAGKQSFEQQLHWLDSVLVVSNDRWKIVIGHHPVYAYTEKDEDERTDMQKRVGVILENRKADFYICGHIHNFQYIKPQGCNVNYVVNSSASQSRPVKKTDGTVFCNPDPGFTIFSIGNKTCAFSFINHRGENVYNYTVSKGVVPIFPI